MLPALQLSSTCWLPGPLYWYMTTGYWLLSLKSGGSTMMALSCTPPSVGTVMSLRCPRVIRASFWRRSALSSRVLSVRPLASHRVVTGGVSRLLYTFMKYLKVVLKMASLVPCWVDSFTTLPLASQLYTALRMGASWLAA